MVVPGREGDVGELFCYCSGNPEVECPVCQTKIPLDKCFRDNIVESEPANATTLQCSNHDCPWERKKQNLKAGGGERLCSTHDDLIHLSGPLEKAVTRTVKPAVVNQELATPIPLSHYNHQGGTFNANTPDYHDTHSPKTAHHTEDVTKTGLMEETAPSVSLTSELKVFHRPLPAMPKRPPIHYPRDGTFPMNFGQSCLSFACCSPTVEVTTTGHDDCEPLLRLTIVPEQESLRDNMDSELAF